MQLAVKKLVIHSIVKEYGLDMLLKNVNMLAVSNKTKHTMKQLEGVLQNTCDANCFSSLTEIPVKQLINYQQQGNEIKDIIEHPEMIDADFRQFEKIRYLQEVMKDYEKDRDISYESTTEWGTLKMAREVSFP